MNMVDVDFEWFDVKPEIDFHGLKTLLRQLFDVDNQLFDLSELVELILSEPRWGSTVKVDGEESDPFAFLTVVNLQQHKDKQVIKDLIAYLLSKATSVPALAPLQELLGTSSKATVGLLLSERLINMPAEIAPPLYNFLVEELKEAATENDPIHAFTHFLILSKTYTEVSSLLDAEDDRPSKKKKKAGQPDSKEVFYFHAEDEVLQRHAVGAGNFEYTRQGDEGASDSRRAFQEMGVRPEGHVILLEAGRLAEAAEAVGAYIGSQPG